MTAKETDKDTKPGYAYQFSADLGSGRILQVTGNLPIGATTDDMNAEFDKVRAALDRQLAKGAVVAIEAEVDRDTLTLNSLAQDLKTLDERWHGKEITNQDKQSRANIETSIRQLQAKIDNKQKYLEQVRKEAA